MKQKDNPPSLMQELFYMYNCITDLSTIRGTQNHSGFYKHRVSLESVNHGLRKSATYIPWPVGSEGRGGGGEYVQQNVNKNMFVRRGIYLLTPKSKFQRRIWPIVTYVLY